mmetsp:Transcript_26330/g.61245  ORF Transcript_26330/g.61245 Transcript_26330/m.61245 type:complete len:204 (+) Transcript_26330:1739-2350(+)
MHCLRHTMILQSRHFGQTSIRVVHFAQFDHFLFDKRVCTQQGTIMSLRWVFLTTATHKVQHFGAPIIRVGQCRGRFIGNHKDCSQWVQVGMWWGSLCHFNHGDAQRPHIGPTIVMRFPNHFRCHPKRGSYHRFALIQRVGELRRDTKVRQFDMCIFREQDIATFDISMTDTGNAMQIFEPQNNAGRHGPNAIFRNRRGEFQEI